MQYIYKVYDYSILNILIQLIDVNILIRLIDIYNNIVALNIPSLCSNAIDCSILVDGGSGTLKHEKQFPIDADRT